MKYNKNYYIGSFDEFKWMPFDRPTDWISKSENFYLFIYL